MDPAYYCSGEGGTLPTLMTIYVDLSCVNLSHVCMSSTIQNTEVARQMHDHALKGLKQ